MINEMKDSISASAAVDSFDHSFDKIIVLEKKQLVLIKKIHDQSTIDHSDIRRTMKIIQRFFIWSDMKVMIIRYIRNCHFCQRAKAFRNEYHDELMSISIANRSWKDISLDFVIQLLNSQEYNTILMIVCRMSKMRHLISCFANDEDTSFDETTRLLIRYVWKLHEFLKTIISDRDSQFISILWKTLCKILEIKAKLSTVFHSETDDQSERANQNMKRFLRIYVNY